MSENLPYDEILFDENVVLYYLMISPDIRILFISLKLFCDIHMK